MQCRVEQCPPASYLVQILWNKLQPECGWKANDLHTFLLGIKVGCKCSWAYLRPYPLSKVSVGQLQLWLHDISGRTCLKPLTALQKYVLNHYNCPAVVMPKLFSRGLQIELGVGGVRKPGWSLIASRKCCTRSHITFFWIATTGRSGLERKWSHFLSSVSGFQQISLTLLYLIPSFLSPSRKNNVWHIVCTACLRSFIPLYIYCQGQRQKPGVVHRRRHIP